jgi:hypothetical protein
MCISDDCVLDFTFSKVYYITNIKFPEIYYFHKNIKLIYESGLYK